ncbi:MAG: NAD-dependent epimerase, partial [Pirellulales bacterium]|nr:NAD-dependent epimerase [Pirellulales bacterium]
MFWLSFQGYRQMKVLVTGSAGFIGSAVSIRLLERGDEVIGVDNLNDYYDVDLKLARCERNKAFEQFTEVIADISDRSAMSRVFADFQPERVINLAAQAGVRYSIENPQAYIDANLVGFGNILEECRQHNVKHLVYASSSSVYGGNTKMPFSVHDNVDHPLSLYAATKKANELMAYAYTNLYQLPTTGLRFFTVYGPWGRPDMALFLFTRSILAGEPIDVFNYGKHRRDFTYIDDIATGVVRTLDRILEQAVGDKATSPPMVNASGGESTDELYRIYNIGNRRPVELEHYISILEDRLGKKAEKRLLPLQPGDVPDTYADVEDLIRDVDYCPETTVEEGITRFVDWYR